MIELRLVCECGNVASFSSSYCYYSGSCNGKENSVASFYTQQRYICLKCGWDMKIQIVKVESETIETIIGD